MFNGVSADDPLNALLASRAHLGPCVHSPSPQTHQMLRVPTDHHLLSLCPAWADLH